MHISTYFDSNVHENITHLNPTYGLKLGGDINHSFTYSKMRIGAKILSQAYLDALYKYESKLIVNSQLHGQYPLSSKIGITTYITHFQKSFYQQSQTYLWTEYGAFLNISPTKSFTYGVGYQYKPTKFLTRDTIRYRQHNLKINGKYNLNRRVVLGGSIQSNEIAHTDYLAWTVQNDTGLVISSEYQVDSGLQGVVYLQRRGDRIFGFQIGVESVTSNSVIGEYQQVHYQAYYSGHWEKTIFYHFIVQRVLKNYTYTDIPFIKGYYDPEELIQNRTHFRIEKIIGNSGNAYFQISLLENETVNTQRYYDKVLINIGIKHTL